MSVCFRTGLSRKTRQLLHTRGSCYRGRSLNGYICERCSVEREQRWRIFWSARAREWIGSHEKFMNIVNPFATCHYVNVTLTWKGYLILPRSSNFHISSRFHFYEWKDCVRQIYNIDYRIYVLRRNFVRSSKISNHPRNVSTAIVGNDQWRPLYLFTITHNLRVVNQIEVNCWTSHTTDLSASVILNTCTESDWSLDERLRVVITQYEL